MPPLPTPCPICGGKRIKPGRRCAACEAAKARERRAGLVTSPVTEPEASRSRFLNWREGTKYLITSAQNATPVHKAFFETLKVAAKSMGAVLVVVPLRYKNPTSDWSASQENAEVWAEEVQPYLYDGRVKLNPNLVLVADVKVQPTAQRPLSGFESLTGGESCIIGHPKMQLKAVSSYGRTPKVLSTTGSCTVRNFTDSRAGALGKFHHFLGAIVVELKGKKFWIRQLNAARGDGSFIDRRWHYTREGVKKAPRALALSMGDTHARFTDPKVDAATFGPGGIVEELDPEQLVWNDTNDGYAINPHHRGNPFIARAKMLAKYGDVEKEVRFTVDFVKARTKGRRSVIVASNHDDFLARWIVDADWKSSPINAEFYLETALALVRATKMGPGGAEYPDPFVYWVEKLRGDADIVCLKAHETYKIGGIEHSLHGDIGPNGSKGTIQNLTRTGARINSGHTHSPGIEDGHYKAGTSTPLELEYTHGPSNWLQAHIATYANKKRAIIVIIDGEWHG